MIKKLGLGLGLVASATLLLAGCAATQANVPGASKVLLSPNQPPKGCKYLGQVVGNQGNFFTGAYTSNKNLEEGAMNDMRNKAANMGGNYVQLLSNRAGVTGSGNGGGSQTNVVYSGNVYNCAKLET